MIDDETKGLLEATGFLIDHAERSGYFEFAAALREAKAALKKTPAMKNSSNLVSGNQAGH